MTLPDLPRDLPLADLHRHLDGSLRLSTLRDLADRARVALPERIGFWPGMGLAEARLRRVVQCGHESAFRRP